MKPEEAFREFLEITESYDRLCDAGLSVGWHKQEHQRIMARLQALKNNIMDGTEDD